MMASPLIFLVSILPLILTSRECGNPSCFVKKLFDFTFPNEGVYSVALSGNPTEMNNSIKAYGDFNSDLRADYVTVDNSNNTIIFIFSTSNNLYEPQTPIPPFQNCNPVNYFLYDINSDGSLDITVWGNNQNGNCMYPLIQTETGFNVGVTNTMNLATTTQPSLFDYSIPAGGSTVKTTCLLIYNNTGVPSRQATYFQSGAYQTIPWGQAFTSTNDYSIIPFSDQHWNTYIDLTNDCFPDFVITNNQFQIQFWIYNSSSNTFFLSSIQNITGMLAMNIIDVNYDGGLDIVIAEKTHINIYLGTNTLNIDSTFCVGQSYGFGFQWWAPIIFNMESNQVLLEQNLQFADLNIDGYPEMMVLVSINGGPNSILIYENQFLGGNTFGIYNIYNDKAIQFISQVNQSTIISTSFFDILDNGIVDIIINLNTPNGPTSLALYNNYLYQNSFYIKAYATNGKSTSKGAQMPGVTFYWLNSVGNSQKVSIWSQITQTSYNALPMPYVLTGLGRANNYVEMFTIGKQGEPQSWSPIIPNSQLAIFAGNEPASSWNIKIFIMPADSLVYVIIVCIVILTILGFILLGIKCHRKRNEQKVALLNDI